MCSNNPYFCIEKMLCLGTNNTMSAQTAVALEMMTNFKFRFESQYEPLLKVLRPSSTRLSLNLYGITQSVIYQATDKYIFLRFCTCQNNLPLTFFTFEQFGLTFRWRTAPAKSNIFHGIRCIFLEYSHLIWRVLLYIYWTFNQSCQLLSLIIEKMLSRF